MHPLKAYMLPLNALPAGIHAYQFEVGDDFFACFKDVSQVSRGELALSLEVRKDSTVLALTFHFLGKVLLTCDRCLGEFWHPMDFSERLFVKFGEKSTDPTEVDDVLELGPEENSLDLSQHIYEYVHLNLPYRKVHPEDAQGQDGCDPEMLARLEALSAPPEPDPRWDKLKTILN